MQKKDKSTPSQVLVKQYEEKLRKDGSEEFDKLLDNYDKEIEDDEDLGILGSFLVVLGEEISLASEIRISCKEKFKDQSGIQGQIQDIFDRSYKPDKKKVKRKVSKKK